MRHRIRRIIRINLSLIICLFILAELIFGNWIFGPDYNLLNVPRNETRNFDVSEFIEEGKVITYTRDQHGLRGKYGGDPANIDILVIGGSTTNERFLDDRESWVAQLQERFHRVGRKLIIVNAGVDGQSTRGHIAALDLWFPNVPALKPRHIIGYLGINDVVVGKNREQYDDMQSPEFSRQFRQYIMNHSVFYKHFRRIRGFFVARRTRVMHGNNLLRSGSWVPVLKWTNRNELKLEIAEHLQSYRARLRTLAFRIRRYGAEPIFVTQRRGDYRFEDGQLLILIQKEQLQSKTYQSDREMLQMTLFNQATLAVCGELKLTCLDLDSDIELEADDFYDSLHTMPSGSAKIADFLYKNLKDRLK